MTTFYRRLRMAHGPRWKSDRPILSDIKRQAEVWLDAAAIVPLLLIVYGLVTH